MSKRFTEEFKIEAVKQVMSATIPLQKLRRGSVYGYRKVRDDLRDLGETCGKHRVYRLMRDERLRSHRV